MQNFELLALNGNLHVVMQTKRIDNRRKVPRYSTTNLKEQKPKSNVYSYHKKRGVESRS